MSGDKIKVKIRWEEDGFFIEENGKSRPIDLTVKIAIVRGTEEQARRAIHDVVEEWIKQAEIIG